jgi:hypothetical protein
MWWLEASSVILIIGSCGVFIGGLCYNMRHSRCERISVCCGLFECERKIMTLEEQEADATHNPPPNNVEHNNPPAEQHTQIGLR